MYFQAGSDTTSSVTRMIVIITYIYSFYIFILQARGRIDVLRVDDTLWLFGNIVSFSTRIVFY